MCVEMSCLEVWVKLSKNLKVNTNKAGVFCMDSFVMNRTGKS